MLQKINPNDLLILIEARDTIASIMEKYNVKGGLEDGYYWARALYNEFLDGVSLEESLENEEQSEEQWGDLFFH